MPFDWMQPAINAKFAKKMEPRLEQGRLLEVERRARLLFNLKYDKKLAARRIRDDVEWEYELATVPAFAKKIKAIVDRVYNRRSG